MLNRLERLVGTRVAPVSVGVTRVMLGAALAIISLDVAAFFHGLASGKLAYPFIDGVPRPPEWMPNALLGLGWLVALCLVLGLLPHVMAGLGAAVGATTLLWDQQIYSSHLTLLTILLILLVFAGSGRRLAIPRYRQPGDTVPFWPQLLMMTQVSVVYLFAGLSKVQPTFLSGDPLQEWMWPDLPHWVFVVLAWATVVTEVGLAVALWIPRVRVVAAAVGVALHLSIVTLLDGENLWLLAFALTTTAVYPLFLTRPSLREASA